MGYLPQHPYAFHMQVRKNILLSKGDREQCQQLMAALQIQHLAKQQAPKLSGGETARMALARLLMQSFDLLILDEPTASMDIASTRLDEAGSADLMITCCPFCVLNLTQGAKKIGSKIKVMDLSQVLLEVTAPKKEEPAE